MILKQSFLNHLRVIFVPSEPEEDPATEPEYVKPKLLPVPGDPGSGPLSRAGPGTWAELFRCARGRAAAVTAEHLQGT